MYSYGWPCPCRSFQLSENRETTFGPLHNAQRDTQHNMTESPEGAQCIPKCNLDLALAQYGVIPPRQH